MATTHSGKKKRSTQVKWNKKHYVPNLTVIIPWDGKNPEWLHDAVTSVHPDIPIVIRRGEGTAGNGLNKAIRAVETDYFFVLAADDILHPDCLVRLADAIGTADFAYPTLRKIGEGSGDFTANIFSIHQLQHRNFIPGCFLGKTKAALDVMWDENQPIEDWDFHYRAAMKGYRYVPVPEAIYFYRIHSDSLIHRTGKEAEKQKLTWDDLRYSIVGEQYETHATFLCDLSAGSAYVRGTIPAKYLPGVATQRVTDPALLDEFAKDVPGDLSIVQFPGKRQLPLIDALRKLDKCVMVEVDDDYTSPALVGYLKLCSSYYPPFKRVAELWKAESGLHKNIVARADGVIVSTIELAERYSKLNGNVFLALNSVDPGDWPEPVKFEDGITRVGYACGLQHGPDTELIYDAFKRLSERKDVEIIMLGLDPGWDFPYRHIASTKSLQVYRDVLSILDIGVAPLRTNRFNLCKSDLKWLEYTMAYCATVAQNQRAYNQTMVHGKHGILINNNTQWYKALSDLIDDPEQREEYVKNSLDYVRDHRMPWHMHDTYMYAVGYAKNRKILNVSE